MSVPTFHEVRLEIVRPGKPHNQLLSPLTPYMALCGEGSSITFHIDFEHQQLLNRLERLRYVTTQGPRFVSIPPRLREAEVGELGSEIARILSQIETLSTELARAQTNRTLGAADSIVHLRIVLSGSELSLLPFEMATAPLAYPGEGLELSLQASQPIVVTREIRHGGPVSVPWSRGSSFAPKILVVYAEPEGMKVPGQAHVQAIRTALDPWIRQLPESDRTEDAAENARKRLRFVKNRIRVLPNASIEGIYEMCAAEKFTHVHILAHGATYVHAGNTRYGVALCRNDQSQSMEVVSGQRLAKALQAEGDRGGTRSGPLVVTLATCDSGNDSTVLIPGGSIAHDLHVEGIPWVFASQFPLTVIGSVRMAEILYPRMFRGDDPRQILFELRRQLYRSAQNDHDWASLVVYATLPTDFGSQVAEFCSRQIKAAINVLLEHADSIAATVDTGKFKQRQPEIKTIISSVEDWLRTWRTREPKGNSAEERERRSEIIGMHGTTYKRVALLLARTEGDTPETKHYYLKSLDHYRTTMAEATATNMKYYWSATQYLSLQAICGLLPDQETYELARRLAARDIESRENDSTKAWAHATLAELDLLGIEYAASTTDNETRASIIKSVREHCERLVALKGSRSFHVGSTLRQFRRYRDSWSKDLWNDIADSAIKILSPPGGSDIEFDYPDED